MGLDTRHHAMRGGRVERRTRAAERLFHYRLLWLLIVRQTILSIKLAVTQSKVVLATITRKATEAGLQAAPAESIGTVRVAVALKLDPASSQLPSLALPSSLNTPTAVSKRSACSSSASAAAPDCCTSATFWRVPFSSWSIIARTSLICCVCCRHASFLSLMIVVT